MGWFVSGDYLGHVSIFFERIDCAPFLEDNFLNFVGRSRGILGQDLWP